MQEKPVLLLLAQQLGGDGQRPLNLQERLAAAGLSLGSAPVPQEPANNKSRTITTPVNKPTFTSFPVFSRGLNRYRFEFLSDCPRPIVSAAPQ